MLNGRRTGQYVESAKQFYGALEELETALGATRFLAGDFVTEADAALYVTLVRFDLLYSCYLGPVKYRVQDLKNVSDYLKDLYQIPAFAHHTDFAAIIRQGRIEGEKDGFRASTHYDLALPKIDWDASVEGFDRARLPVLRPDPSDLSWKQPQIRHRPDLVRSGRRISEKRGERNAAVLRMLLRLIKS